jgi:hypothetical protein
MVDGDRGLWFGRTENGIGVAPLSWKGRAVLVGWALLVLVALVTYSTLSITAFVVIFYTVVLVAVVAVKSDLLDEHRQGRG